MGILSGAQTEKTILELINSCKSFSIAVAWATSNAVFQAIKAHENKLGTMIVGIDFWQTHPDVLLWMKKSGKSNMFVGQAKGGVFHPKVFLFEFDESKETDTLVIGSANLTAAAFSKNEEACVRVKVEKNDRSAASLITGWAKNGIPIDAFDISDYRENYLVKGRSVRQSLNARGSEEFRENPDLLKLSFEEYYMLCTKDPYHYFQSRLALLDFCAKPNHSYDEFRCVAGIALAPAPDDELDYGLFGSMGADASFRDTILHRTHWQVLNTLYQRLSSKGVITRVHAKQFIEDVEGHINLCFGNQYKKTNHPSAATRLLAMKRPDQFFCVNGANSKRLADDLGISVNGKRGIRSIDGYLDAVEMLQNSTWGRSRLPDKNTADEDQNRCWRGRVAMIDALYYEPV